jgi:DNA uptake protein ComE-like DNA-binding protein
MKRLPFFTPSQRRALLVIEWLLLLAIIGLSVWKWQSADSGSEKRKAMSRKSDYVVRDITYATAEDSVEVFPFDPNTADSTTLLRLGLSPWQVRSIYRYRAKRGRYSRVEEFRNVPNLTVEQWARLEPYIRIAPRFRYVEREEPRERFEPARAVEPPVVEVCCEDVVPCDTFPRRVKLRVGQTVDVNTADTTLLKMVPGIASKRAARIVAYRNALGGFVTKEQAMEATEMPDSVLRYMTLSPQPVRRVNVNRLSVSQLMKHPYISFYQAKAISEYRRNHGAIQSIDVLRKLDEFRPTDIEKLHPYLEF